MKPRDLICFLAGILIVLTIFSFGHRFRETEQAEPTPPEPEQTEYEISEPMLAGLEQYNRFVPKLKPILLAQPEPDVTDTEPVRYELTDFERQLVCEVVMAESGNQPYCGQMAVAQCLLNACEKDGIRPEEAVREYQYTPNRVEPSESVQRAVSAVFDRGEVAIDETILWFYAPKHVDGTPWHETQRHVLTINDHKFFAEKE